VEDIKPCSNCAVRHFCGAPCPAEVYMCSNTLHTPPPYCEFYVEQIRYAFRFIASGHVDLMAIFWMDGKKDKKSLRDELIGKHVKYSLDSELSQYSSIGKYGRDKKCPCRISPSTLTWLA
jgi:hypothetical protein